MVERKAAEQGLGSNLEAAERLLRRFRTRPVPHVIGGASRTNTDGALFENRSPVDNALLAVVSSGSDAEVDAASRAAENAFCTWRERPGEERRALLHAVADGIERRAHEIALIESMDTGQPIRFTAKTAARGAENFRFFADRAPFAADGLCLHDSGHVHYTMRQAIGPVGVITPWNMPFMLATWKIAPALACGCTVVHKPAEWAPLSASLLAEIALEAGLPDGVLNTVHGTGEEAGRSLTEHPAIRAIAFVGGTDTGSLLMRQGASTLKRLHLELGGKSPVIVFEDADLGRALDAVVFMIYSLNGERCNSGSRLLVQRPLYRDFVEQVAERARRLKVGHPLDPRTEVGPLIHRTHFLKVLACCRKAVEDGAVVMAGGGVPDGHTNGNFLAPTLFVDVAAGSAIAREEVFGPVLAAMPFTDEQEAVSIANSTRYGLSAYVWTRDAERANRLARDLEAGMVWINTEIVRNLATPFGGMKASGIGRDGGDYSFDFYMETKNVCSALGLHHVPRMAAG